jgi:ribosomal protein S18 acetylase RimI-like enzyme
MEIVRLGIDDQDVVAAMSDLFDAPAVPEHTERFLRDDGHHLLVAREKSEIAGFVTGVEMTHPDKGTEMFLYELAVAERWQRQGVGRSLVDALAQLARSHGCYGMWVLTDDDNEAALATYASAGGARSAQTMLEWNWREPIR